MQASDLGRCVRKYLRSRAWKALGVAGAIVLGQYSQAQTARPQAAATPSSAVRMPTQAEMDAQRTHMPSDAALAREPGVAMPRIDTPGVPLQRGIDAGALAAQYEAMRKSAEPAGEHATVGLMVFVTLQMPRGSLQRLVEQAEQSRATLVLRGLKGSSMKDTLAAVAELIGKRKVAWMIDPESFKRYGVTLAPSFVLVSTQTAAALGCTTGQCAAEPVFSKVVGDVSTSFALQTIERSDPAFKSQAMAYRSRLESRP